MPTFPVAGASVQFTFGRSMPTRLSTASIETVRVAVATSTSGTTTDPTDDGVSFAFTTGATPTEDDFVEGDWEQVGTEYFATCLIGAGGATELEADLYAVWLKVSDDPEIPVRRVGDLGVF